METVFTSEYQDIYRLKKGVLFFVNKFDHASGKNGTYDFVGSSHAKRYSSVRYCDLSILQQDTCVHGNVYRVGQILFCGYPISLVDASKWTYQIKSSGDNFSGNSEEMLAIFEEVSALMAGNKTINQLTLNGVTYKSAF